MRNLYCGRKDEGRYELLISGKSKTIENFHERPIYYGISFGNLINSYKRELKPFEDCKYTNTVHREPAKSVIGLFGKVRAGLCLRDTEYRRWRSNVTLTSQENFSRKFCVREVRCAKADKPKSQRLTKSTNSVNVLSGTRNQQQPRIICRISEHFSKQI